MRTKARSENRGSELVPIASATQPETAPRLKSDASVSGPGRQRIATDVPI
jgi:hypothetical protein